MQVRHCDAHIWNWLFKGNYLKETLSYLTLDYGYR